MADPLVEAVIINYDGAMVEKCEPRFVTSTVDRNRAAWTAPISPLSRLLKQPIHLPPLPTGYLDTLDGSVAYRTNKHARSLMPQLDAAGFFELPADWQSPPGSVLAVSADGKGLNTALVEILVDFAPNESAGHLGYQGYSGKSRGP